MDLNDTDMENFKQANATGKNNQGGNINTPLKFLTASSIIGDKVKDPKGTHLGAIKDLMIDLSTGKIEYVVIELGGFLGIGEKYFAFPYSFVAVDTSDETFVLNQDSETLKNDPGFNKDHWPETNTHMFDPNWGGFMGGSTGATP